MDRPAHAAAAAAAAAHIPPPPPADKSAEAADDKTKGKRVKKQTRDTHPAHLRRLYAYYFDAPGPVDDESVKEYFSRAGFLNVMRLQDKEYCDKVLDKLDQFLSRELTGYLLKSVFAAVLNHSEPCAEKAIEFLRLELQKGEGTIDEKEKGRRIKTILQVDGWKDFRNKTELMAFMGVEPIAAKEPKGWELHLNKRAKKGPSSASAQE